MNKKGFVDLVIKIYRPCEKFPDGGIMTKWLDTLKVDNTIEVSGPKGRLNYKGNGQVEIYEMKPGNLILNQNFKRIIMVAGGTGITPLY